MTQYLRIAELSIWSSSQAWVYILSVQLSAVNVSSLLVLVYLISPDFFSEHIGTFNILGSPSKLRFHLHRFIQAT